jgi:hypothetical protein
MNTRIKLVGALAAAAVTLLAFSGTGLAQPTAHWVAARAADTTIDRKTQQELFKEFVSRLSDRLDIPVADLREAARQSRDGERSVSSALDMDSDELDDTIREVADDVLDDFRHDGKLNDAQVALVKAFVEHRLDKGI